MVLTLLAAGAAEPDVLAVTPERADSLAEAVERLNYVPSHVRSGIGAVLLETERPGSAALVVAAVEPGGPAERTGLKVGEGILEADGQAVTSAAELERRLALRRGGDEIPLVVVSRGGERRSVAVPLVSMPTLISVDDQTLLFNALAVVFRNRLDAAPREEAPYIRLNLAVALLRAGDFAGAREHLTAEPLPPGDGISRGTQLYLLGLAHEGLGNQAAAGEAFRAAAEAGGRLTEDGPGIEVTVAAKLGR
jgi:membrane-associated protease RseP (regulator of RpoE activity)